MSEINKLPGGLITGLNKVNNLRHEWLHFAHIIVCITYNGWLSGQLYFVTLTAQYKHQFLLYKEFEIPTLLHSIVIRGDPINYVHSKFFKILKFVFLSAVAHMSFCVKFNGLLSQFRILEKSYLSL